MSGHLNFTQEPHPTNTREVRYAIRNPYDQEPGAFAHLELVGYDPYTAVYQLHMERAMVLSDVDMHDIATARDTATKMYRILTGAWPAEEQKVA